MPLSPTIDPFNIDLSKAFGGMSALSDQILAKADKTNMYYGHLRQVKLPHWYKGRVVLAGDAAHAMMPATGMGASVGIQDADTLARLIATMPIELYDHLGKAYEKNRKPAAHNSQREAYALGRMMLVGKYTAWVRNDTLSLLPQRFFEHLVGAR
jgi:2-polyprenyl-6-methoxyphenol hydroxylase-like FAD-dependent oxidoreductase